MNELLVSLPGWCPDDLLRALQAALDDADWHPDPITGGNFRFEVAALPDVETALREALQTDALRERLQQAFGTPALGEVHGQFKRLRPDGDHWFPWHQDGSRDRLVAVSVNLGPLPFEGGTFELRRKWEKAPLLRHRPEAPGDLHAFDVSDRTLVHRVTPVTGENARVFWAGWFGPRGG